MGQWSKEKKDLCASSLLNCMRGVFSKISKSTSVVDSLMSGLAIFGMKLPSLLQFDQRKDEGIVKHNLNTLYRVEKAPCDTYMREKLDEVDPRLLRKGFTQLFSKLQRNKVLDNYKFLGSYYLLPIDGTGLFSSSSIHCQNCCEKHHKNGEVTYYHNILCIALVHPDHKEVFPLCPEPILKQDGKEKNDCERNAAKRLIADLRREHPHLKAIVTHDSLSANGPYIKELQKQNLRYIIGVKEDGNKSLFDWMKGVKLEEFTEVIDGIEYTYRFINKVPLNDSHPDLEVNFFECFVNNPKKGKVHFSWITDIPITKHNIRELVKGGRARWKIENETFNTLKNQGYQFEHNFGHGNKYLCQVFSLLMLLAFLIDQIQQRCCPLFQAAWNKLVSKTALWAKMRAVFTEYFVKSWTDLLVGIAVGHQGSVFQPNTS